MKALLLFLLATSPTAGANSLRGLKKEKNNPVYEGADFCVEKECGCVRPGCCCIVTEEGILTQSCIPQLCPKEEPANKAVYCGGHGFYTVNIGGKTTIVCMGPKAGDSAVPLPNRAEENGESAVPGSEFDVIEVPEDDEAETSTIPLVCPDDKMKCPLDNPESSPEIFVERDPLNNCQFKPCPPILDGCNKGTWNLSGSGEEFRCESNDDCQLGCCTPPDSQIPGRCISPLINPNFSSFLKCMPEFSKCELNRAFALPVPKPPAKKPPVLIGSIDTCRPGGRSPCCEKASDCTNYGAGCCDRWRKQCVPQVSDSILRNIDCMVDALG